MLPDFVFVGKPINKNGVVIVRKGYYNVIHFSTIGSFYISKYLPVISLDIFRLGYILSRSLG